MTNLKELAKLIRYYILISTTEAGSGHPTSSLSAVELMTALFFGGVFRYDIDHSENQANDRLIFSKGHASPLLYSLWAAAGKISEKELLTLREFDSRLEGHPTPAFPYTEAATGSLGQGLSIGVGMALAARMDNMSNRIYVLLGDSELAEGSNWEAMQIAAHYNLDNLVSILDINRLGQRGETMLGYDLEAYRNRISAFGWETIVVRDGHSFQQISEAYLGALESRGRPIMIIARTVKGKGISFLENKEGWHGKALSRDALDGALLELGDIKKGAVGTIERPQTQIKNQSPQNILRARPSSQRIESSGSKFLTPYKMGDLVATRKAYGNALVNIFTEFPNMVVLDAEVSNSTFSEIFKKVYPEKFFEMFIAEQNMAGAALGLARRGKLPFVSTFAAFLTRAFDQIRMSQYSNAHIVFCGSHAGVSIGQDGPSQMGLEDIAMFRTVLGSCVLYPADAVSCEKLVREAALHDGIVYIRTTRGNTPIIYDLSEDFPIGGSKVLRKSAQDKVTIVAAGVTLFEALVAAEELEKEGIKARVIDCYSVKPLDKKTIFEAAKETEAIITIEDHFAEGGLGEAVAAALSGARARIYSLAVRKMPKSGNTDELLNYEEISKEAIIKKVKGLRVMPEL